MVDEQLTVVVDQPTEESVCLPVSIAQELRDAVVLLHENGVWTDDYPFLPNHDAVLRYNVLRTFADSEVDPKFAIENAEKYINYILNGAQSEAAPISPLKRKLKAV